MNVGSVSQHNLIATDASRKARLTRSTNVERDAVAQPTNVGESFTPKTRARDVERISDLTYSQTPVSTRVSSQENKESPDEETQLPARHSPVQQKAVDFYNITASLGNAGGEGELIGVDTYA